MTAPRGHPTPQRLGGAAALTIAVVLGLGPAIPIEAPPPVPVAEAPPTTTVTLVGTGDGAGPLGQRLPSGQTLAYQAVPGWGLPAGIQAGATTVAADGTVFVAGRDYHGGGGPPTADELVIGAYQPRTGTHTQIRLPVLDARTAVAGDPGAPSIAGLAPLPGTEAVAYTIGAVADDSRLAWPVFGILAKADGEWTVASQWSGAELRTAGPPWSERACPEDSGRPAGGDCRGLGEMAALPGSGDLLVAQAGVPGWHNGALLALRVAGPDAGGKFTVAVTGHYLYPGVGDPQTRDSPDIALHGLRADPTGEPGDERFVVGLRDLGDTNGSRPMAIQEFTYDAASGAITPVSAPTIPGDRANQEAGWYGYSAALYDSAGNLWAARHNVIAGGDLAVYAAGDGGGVLHRPDCPFRPDAPPGEYRTGEVWGQACPPDYDIVQARDLPALVGLVQEPDGADIVALSLGGALLPIRPSGEGDTMTFQIGNLVDTGLALLPPATEEGHREHQLGAFDAGGQLWLAGANALPRQPEVVAEQWLYGVRVGDLFDPPPVRLPDVPGREVIVQAGHTATIDTAQMPGAWAAVDVVSRAHLRGCAEWSSTVDSCSHDGVAGNGFVLGHHSGFGHLGGEVAYPVEVPVAGRYRVAYRVSTFEVTTEAAITLSAGDASYTTPVNTGGAWRTLPQQEPIELPAGEHTIRLEPPQGQGGWFLSWFSLQRA